MIGIILNYTKFYRFDYIILLVNNKKTYEIIQKDNKLLIFYINNRQKRGKRDNKT